MKTILVCCMVLASVPAAAQYYDPFQPQPYNPYPSLAPGWSQPQQQPFSYQRRQGPTTYQRFGNSLMFDNRGNSWQQMGPFTFGSDGSVCQRLGQMVFCR